MSVNRIALVICAWLYFCYAGTAPAQAISGWGIVHGQLAVTPILDNLPNPRPATYRGSPLVALRVSWHQNVIDIPVTNSLLGNVVEICSAQGENGHYVYVVLTKVDGSRSILQVGQKGLIRIF